MHPDTQSLLSHPEVLRAAWRRVQRWYAYGDQPPEPEYSRWRQDPEGELEAFAGDLAKGNRPDLQLPLVPYPKKGAMVRHYCRPSVEVQLYFTAYAVLLAPWLERSMEACSFGNRWFRGVYRKPVSAGGSIWHTNPTHAPRGCFGGWRTGPRRRWWARREPLS